jgi:hypothetical protein
MIAITVHGTETVDSLTGASTFTPDNVLIKDVLGTPTDGYGQAFHTWLVNHA